MKSNRKTLIYLSGFLLVGMLVIPSTQLSFLSDEEPAYKLNRNSIKTAADPTLFISIWNTNLTSSGSSASNQVCLPLIEEGMYNFTVNWGDENTNSITSWEQAEKTHTYSAVGAYTVEINGTIIGWQFDYGGDRLKITEIQQWGCLQLGNTGSYFSGCVNLILTTTDKLNLTGTTNLCETFFDCSTLGAGGNLNNWDVSHVTDMSGMFASASAFNQPLGDWDVSHVTNMREMFQRATIFNQSLETWNVSNVTNMRGMFGGASAFNRPIGNWDISNVTEMRGMFGGASVFNQPLGTWDVSKVTIMDTIFYNASAFNQPLGDWDVSHVTDMSRMFNYASVFNQPLGTWDVSHVTIMSGMFASASAFNQPLGDWNVSHVTNMGDMFYYASTFNQPLGDWDVSHVTDMSKMFCNATAFNQPLNTWDVSHVTGMIRMFSYASVFNQPLGTWNVSNVINMRSMFNTASAFNQPLGTWNVSRVTNMSMIFSGVTLSTANYDHLLLGWSQLPLQPGVIFHGGNSKYSSAATAARQSIIDTYNWTISDGGEESGNTTTTSSTTPKPPISTGLLIGVAIGGIGVISLGIITIILINKRKKRG